jgi:transcriptional regulator with XRE-family HTH domain
VHTPRSASAEGADPRGSRPPVGALLREWRVRLGLSQLDLALRVDISARHLSFVETGRSRPTREMILRLAEGLDVPLRERNRLLLAGGYAPGFPEHGLDAPEMVAVRAALRRLLEGHDPYPAAVVDRHWHLVEANTGLALFTEGIAAELLTPPVNVLRLALHPAGMAPHVVNLGEWRAHLLGRLRRQAAVTADARLTELYRELRDYPCDQPEPEVALPGPADVLVPLRYRHRGRELALLSTTAVFGTPLDVTVAELAIESFFPADPATSAALRDLAGGEE